jgi:hypothetical protein
MPSIKFDAKAESTAFELLPDGDYPFEVVAYDTSISTGAKTSGSEQMEIKVAFFADETFAKKRAQWTETLIFHPSSLWKLSVFAKCTDMRLPDGTVPGDGVDLEFSEATVVGLRGWASVRSKASTKDPAKRFNHVAVWLTTKPKLARREIPAEEMPVDEPSGKGLPF